MTQKKSLVLVLNCGSSSVKGAVIDCVTGAVLFSCLAEKLNLPDAFITIKDGDNKEVVDLSHKAHHTGAIEAMMEALKKRGLDKQIGAVGHRIVHGGEHFKESTIVNEDVVDNIQKCITLAPLHNPAHLLGISAAQNVFHHIPHVVVFDTAFHQTMPDYAYTYAIPHELYQELGLRRYGAHGTSCRYVAGEASRMLDRPLKDLALVIAHLGNGASITAVEGGKVKDTSMGLTPLEGLVMGTRCGDIDASVFSFLHEQKGWGIGKITEILNKKSGMLGISGVSNDYRVVEESAHTGNHRSELALEVFGYRLAKYIAAMTVAAGRLDALIFTGGIGENSKSMRENVMNKLGFLGLYIDDQLNAEMRFGKSGIISRSKAPLAMVIPTNEELMIAQDAARLTGLID
ncbi:MAG: acetate kinase [Neisseriaceae bacterium]|nr:acetate kinase [Neisseriaceae bacterium]